MLSQHPPRRFVYKYEFLAGKSGSLFVSVYLVAARCWLIICTQQMRVEWMNEQISHFNENLDLVLEEFALSHLQDVCAWYAMATESWVLL